MARTEVFTTTVKLNSEEAKNKLEELNQRVKHLKQDYDAALASGNFKLADDIGKELKKAKAELRTFKTEIQNVDDILDNLSSASIDQLTKAAKSLNAQIRHLATDTQEFADKQAELKKVKQRLQEIRVEGQAQEPWLNRMADWFNKIQGIAIAAVAAITGLTMTIRKSTQDYADMEEAMVDVEKYTGMSTEAVHNLNEEFKQMDTRTSREKLNALAGDAGRLGKQGTQDILDFVDAADKIDVALGDDLGENAVRDIGKLSETFGDSDRMGLRGAMLATASAVNELSQSSSAAGGYIVEFTSTFAGLGNQANISQQNIMGFASVLDQNMQHMETSSTALSQLVTKMFQDPAKFAKLAGQDVKEFTDLLKTDANEALLTFLDSMKQRGGFDSLAPMFAEMGLNGTRCVGVLSTLATNIDDVREAQSIANKAFAEGTSVLDEFDRANNSEQANIDKAKKKLHDVSVELGEKLLPVVQYTISGTSLLINALNTIIKVVSEYKDIIATAALAIAAYTVVLNAQMIAQKAKIALDKLEVFWTEKVVVASKKLWATLIANPYAALAAAVVVLVGLMARLASSTDEATYAQRELNRLKDEAKKKSADEEYSIRRLIAASRDEKLSLDERMNAIKQLQEIIPGYVQNLDAETSRYQANEEALKNYITQLRRKYEVEGAEEQLKELGRQRADLTLKKTQLETSIKNAKESTTQTYTTSWGMVSDTRSDIVGNLQRELATVESDIKKIQAAEDLIENTYGTDINALHAGSTPLKTEVTPVFNPTSGGSSSSGGKNDPKKDDKKEEDPYKAEADRLQAAYDREAMIRKQAYAEDMADTNLNYEEKIQAEEDYEEDMYKLSMDFYDKMAAVYPKEHEEWVKWQDKKAETRAEHDKKIFEKAHKDLLENEKKLREEEERLQKERESARSKTQAIIDADERKNEKDPLKRREIELRQQEEMIESFHDQELITEEQYLAAVDALRASYAAIDRERQAQHIDEVKEKVHDALTQLNNIVGAAGEFVSASYQRQIAEVESRYDAEIEAAGKNKKKVEKLEKEKQETVAKLQKEEAKKQMTVDIAQTLLNTAMSISETFKTYGYTPWGIAMAAAAASMGAIQLATVKEQAAAKIAGYYYGGFTGGGDYTRVAGVVHEGEFVANHKAVQNRNVRPVLELLDWAQRNNTVGSLTAQDVSAAIGGQSGTVVAPIVNVANNNEDLQQMLVEVSTVMASLTQRLDAGIKAYSVISGPDGSYEQTKKYEKLLKSK